MSLIRDPAIITKAGKQLITAGGDITYTKATLYNQDISHLTKEQLEALTSLGNPVMTVPVGISDKSGQGESTTIVLEATFQNSGLQADTSYKAIGFFAKKGKDGQEQLVIVGVAVDGAYLVAASPDGVATDALDIKVEIAIGDAVNVTAVVDPAGSVTPATLNGTINNLSHDLNAKIDANADSTSKALDTKADKSDVANSVKQLQSNIDSKADNQAVTAQLATKANQSDLDKTNATVATKADSKSVSDQLATKANASDVSDSVKKLQAGIDSKADKATVDAEIAKIDFTPYAKTADVDSKLSSYTTTSDLTKLLANKRDISDSYSRAELDKKLLEMSTDTDGKVNADQVATMIEGKADKTDVDAKIKTVTDLANTKANSADVYDRKAVDTAFSQRDNQITNAQNTATQASEKADSYYNKRPVITGSGGDDLFAYKTNQLRLYPGNGQNCKNMPPASNKQWYTVEYVFETPNGDGLAIYRSPASEVWINGNNGGIYGNWLRIANAGDIENLQNQINQQVNANWAIDNVNGQFNAVKTNYDASDRSTQSFTTAGLNLLNSRATEIDQLKGRRGVDNPDFNTLTDSGTYYVSDPTTANHAPEGSWGNLLVSNGNNERTSQMYFPDNGASPYVRVLDGDTWRPWLQLANTSQVADALNTGKQAQAAADSANNNANGRLGLTGGNMNTGSVIQWNGGGIDDKTGNLGGVTWAGGTDWAKIYGDQDGDDNLDLAFDLGDDGSNKFSFRKSGGEVSAIQSNGHYTGSVDWGNVWGRPQDQINRINVVNTLYRELNNTENWANIFGVSNPNPVLASIRVNGSAPGSLLNNYSAGIGFGGADTKGVLTVAYGDHQARISGGNGSAPAWSEDIAWKSDITDLRNQLQQLRENQFEIQTFTDENAAKTWEAQKTGHRLAIINK